MAELRRHAKFGQNRLNRGRDMTIFRFSKMAAEHIRQLHGDGDYGNTVVTAIVPW